MQIAVIETDVPPPNPRSKHNWFQLFYMFTSFGSLILQFYLRISLNNFYASYTYKSIPNPSLNRYPTQFTASIISISYIWYLVYIWQIIWIIYSFLGLFRRTTSGTYFYIHPCPMNKQAFFYISIAHIFYLPILLTGTTNKYSPLIPYFYAIEFVLVFFSFAIVKGNFERNLSDYFREKYFLDVCLVQFIYLNGLAAWLAIVFYEFCLSITIFMLYLIIFTSKISNIIGIIIFALGLQRMLFYEIKQRQKGTITLIFSHWLISLWLLCDVLIFVNFKLGKINSNTILLFIVVCFILIRIVYLFYQICTDKFSPIFHSGRVYSLITPPQAF